MRRRDFLARSGLALGLSAFPLRWIAAEDAKPQKVLYFTRNCGYEHSVVHRNGDELSHSEKAMIDMGKRVGLEIVCTKDGRVFDDDIDQYDAFAFYTNNDLTQPNERNVPPMTQRGKERFLAAIEGGKGFIGFHSTCASWRSPGADNVPWEQMDPFLRMLGGEFVAHGPQQKATMRITSPKFPGMEGLGDSFEMLEEWYALKNFAPDLHVILVQETAGMQGDCYQRPSFPSTWARMQGKGRVYFTSLAHRENVWVEEPMQQIVLGGLAWVLGNVDVEIPANIDQVTPQCRQLHNK